MERKKLILLFVISYSFFVAGCGSENESKELNSSELNADESKSDEQIISEPQTVQWMYIDDSLRLLCKPLFYSLPWMESDIRELPEQITPELFSLAPLKNFETREKSNGSISDSLYYFGYDLLNGDCYCKVYRFYKGNSQSKDFSGYSITEQIICNATNYGLPKINAEPKVENHQHSDTTETYEIHGHDH